VRIDQGPSGVQTNLASWSPRINGDGRYIVYMSWATNLVASDTNFASDIFFYDVRAASTVRVSVDSVGAQANGDSDFPDVSSDGNLVVFQSAASNLVAGDTNGQTDIFLRNMSAGTTTRISVDSTGAEANNFSFQPRISADGRFVVFESAASNLVPGDTNGAWDVFVRDLTANVTTRVSVDSFGVEGNGTSGAPSISADGRYVLFESTASNLVPGDTNGASDVFLHDNFTGVTSRVSVGDVGQQGNGDSLISTISPSGRLVAFSSAANNLVAGDTNGDYDVFVRDLVAGTTTRVSTNSSGGQAIYGNIDPGSFYPAISGNDRYVAFDSGASNLVAVDVNPWPDVFVKDLQTGVTNMVSISTSGGQGSFPSQSGTSSITDDGRFVVFYSYLDLVPNDTNNMTDIYVRDRNATGFTSLCDPGVAGVNGCPCANAPSGSGRGCDNSAGTGGASLAASGLAYLSTDTVVFTTSGEKPTATSVLLQGTTIVSSGATYGQGVRCVGGTLKRLFTKSASGGSITAPNFGGGDPTISARSAAKGNVISAGSSRWYLVFYRDPTVLGGCPAASTFNATQTGRIDWSF
jgi:hypothetical protein